MSYEDRMALAFESELEKIAVSAGQVVSVGRKAALPVGAIIGYKALERAHDDWRTGRQYRKAMAQQQG